jgi:hypothetical protein
MEGKNHTQLYVKVLAARGVHPNGGAGDVYCSVYLDGTKVFRTAELKHTVDPVFENEKGKIFNLADQKEVVIAVKDAVTILPNSFLGQISFGIESLKDGVPRSGWYPLEGRPNKKDKVQGEVQVQVMFSERPDGQITLEDFNTPIQVLLKKQKVAQLKTMLDKSKESLEAKDKDGNTGLHVAAQLDNIEAVNLLLKAGADVKAKNEQGRTPLHVAAEKSVNSISPLLDGKADIEAKDKDGARPLHIAASANNTKAVALLLEKGASVNAQDDKGNSPLHNALSANGVDSVRALASHKKVDIYRRNKNDQHAAHLALKIGGDLKRAFMEAVKVEDDREFEVVDSGFPKRYRLEGENLSMDYQKSNQFLVTAAVETEAKLICHFIGSGAVAANSESAASKVGFCIVKTTEGKHHEMSYQTNCLGYGGLEPTLFKFQPGQQIAILPYSQSDEAKGKFSMLFFTKAEAELTIKPLTPWKNSMQKKSEWKGESAGGCNQEPNPWRKNPHFLLRLPKGRKDVEVLLMLEQTKSTLDIIPYQVHPYAFHIGFYIYDKEVEAQLDRSVWQNAREVTKHFKFDATAHQELIIIPTTVKTGQETAFTLSVFSDEELEVEKFNPPKIVDVTS